MAWLKDEQLCEMGFSSIGRNVMLSDKASFHNCKKIRLGDNVRIDDFCILSAGVGGLEIGDYVHIAAFAAIIGAGKITIADFCGISSRVSIYSSNDDYSGAAMTGPIVPSGFTNVYHADVNIGRHVIIGVGSIILPGVTLEDGVAIGALSLVKNNCESFGVYTGVPAKRVKERKHDILDLEIKLKNLECNEQ